MFTLKCRHTQDGDIIAPDLTPLKPSWQENNKGKEGEDGSSTVANRAKSAKAKLF